MIDFDTFDALIREKGPLCPDFGCDHAYCQVMRTLRLGLDEGADALVLAAPSEIRGEGERACRECGCTEDRACIHACNGQVERCGWAEPDLCTACVPGQKRNWIRPPRTAAAPGG